MSRTLKSREETVECYACTQVGVPVFHSSACDAAHKPQWEASAGSSLIPIGSRLQLKPFQKSTKTSTGPLGRVLDPRSRQVRMWNRAFMLARAVSVAVDPLFFYTLCIGRNGSPCLSLDHSLAIMVVLIRTCVDALQLGYLYLQFRLAYLSRESLVVGCGKLVWDARDVASHYLRSLKGFWFDTFVILPIPQVVTGLIVPKLIGQGRVELAFLLMLLTFFIQFVPKIYHTLAMTTRLQKVTGYIFASAWWGFGLAFAAYLTASHAIGGFWYLLAVQRVSSCVVRQCQRRSQCSLRMVCSIDISPHPHQSASSGQAPGLPGGDNSTRAALSLCLAADGPFQYGIYEAALQVMSSNSAAVKIFYPIFWGLSVLSTFGNVLEPTSSVGEVIFSICSVLGGLTLFTILVGKIQVFLSIVMAKKKKMQLRRKDMEWWMKHRQLPSPLQQRVHEFEQHSWAAMGGEDEMELIKDWPEGLRRDIKRYLCLDLIRKVPLFHYLDDLILDNICDRVRPLYFSLGEKIIREGDPVQRIIFLLHGRVKSSQGLGRGKVATTLLSWCLHRPFVDRLPASSSTYICARATDAFGLDADHLRYLSEQFRYRFVNERLKGIARYYSSHWRTWAAVNIQMAWRRCRKGRGSPVIGAVEWHSGGSDRRLRQYAAVFMSIKPHHLQ
uniref:Cyclic nucleotide-binding domain-containing protein n=1 Tax=Kalanchoe fedtschenkoi TaxID=63787 RepID=A0A7N0T9Q1_KALFE